VDKRTIILLSVVFIDLVGFGIVIPILPLLVEKTGGGAFMVGVVIAIFSLFQFIFSPILGRLSDKYGRRPVLILSSFINAISYFLIFLSQSLPLIILARIVAGVGSANISVAQAYIADVSSSHERTKKMALIGAAFGLGFIVGPLLGGVVSDTFGVSAAFIIPAVLSAANTVLIFFFLPESNKSLQKHIKIEFINMRVTREVMRPKNMSFLLILFFLVNVSLSLIIGVFPLYSKANFGWNEAQNGYYFGLIGIGSFFTQAFLINLLLRKFDETQMVRLGILVFGITIAAIGLSPIGWITLVLGPLTSFSFSLINVNVQSLISLESDESEQGIVMGVAQSFGAIARVFGPLAGGIIATFNLSMPYVVSGLLMILILFWGQGYLKFMKASKISSPRS
jgi:multidrug resistance protein